MMRVERCQPRLIHDLLDRAEYYRHYYDCLSHLILSKTSWILLFVFFTCPTKEHLLGSAIRAKQHFLLSL